MSETDYTIIDLVSDLRVPTPTAAAEKAVPIKLELIENLYSLIYFEIIRYSRYSQKLKSKSRALGFWERLFKKLFTLLKKTGYVLTSLN